MSTDQKAMLSMRVELYRVAGTICMLISLGVVTSQEAAFMGGLPHAIATATASITGLYWFAKARWLEHPSTQSEGG
jgi:hypothetical protein